MFRRIQDFLTSWARESEATLSVLGKLTDTSLQQRVTPDGRTLGRIAWHLTQTLPEMGGRTGLEIKGPEEADPVPATASEIATAYTEAAESLASQIQERWSDEDLDREDDMYGTMWPRGQSLWILVAHQTHHRGQMTVLMRQAGLPVPGVYGPAREEWSDYGVPPQE